MLKITDRKTLNQISPILKSLLVNDSHWQGYGKDRKSTPQKCQLLSIGKTQVVRKM